MYLLGYAGGASGDKAQGAGRENPLERRVSITILPGG